MAVSYWSYKDENQHDQKYQLIDGLNIKSR